jgi:hypothetical protein
MNIQPSKHTQYYENQASILWEVVSNLNNGYDGVMECIIDSIGVDTAIHKFQEDYVDYIQERLENYEVEEAMLKFISICKKAYLQWP